MSDGGREIYSEGMGTTDGPGQGGLVDGQTAKGDRAEGRTGPMGVKAKRGYGFIYFIETENHEYIKIGFSTRPIMRLQDLSTVTLARLRTQKTTPEQRSEISRKAGIAAGIANRERRYQ